MDVPLTVPAIYDVAPISVGPSAGGLILVDGTLLVPAREEEPPRRYTILRAPW